MSGTADAGDGGELTRLLLMQGEELRALRPLRAALERYGQALLATGDVTVLDFGTGWSRERVDAIWLEVQRAYAEVQRLALALATDAR